MSIPLDQIAQVGQELSRPECVLCTANGRAYVSDWRGGISVLEPDGSQWQLLARQPEFDIRPNGITLMADGTVLLSHLGPETGGVFRLHANGDLEPFVTEADGEVLPPTNYAHLDAAGRVWITVSTRRVPRAKAYRADVADGFIVLADDRGARIVADGLGYTNECIVHPDGRRLYVNETFARRLSAFDIGTNGDLGNRQTIAEFDAGTFPDGLAFDADSGAWITSIVSNRVIRIPPGGEPEIVVEDNDAGHLEWVEAAFVAGEMGRPHLDQVRSRRLRNISSLAFGGLDLKSAYLGCLLGNTIYRFAAPVAGHPTAHWHFHGPRRRA